VTWPQPYDASPFSAHLLPGERVMWSGQPDPRRLFQAADWFVVPFTLAWAGFAFFWEASVIAMGAPVFMALFGLPFVLIGLYMLFGRFVHQAWTNRLTWFVLTDSRALVVYGRDGQRARSVQLDDVRELSVLRRPDGSGTISFNAGGAVETRRAAVVTTVSSIRPGWSTMESGPLSFTNISDVATVQALADSFTRDLR
jgi:hypothetical protein